MPACSGLPRVRSLGREGEAAGGKRRDRDEPVGSGTSGRNGEGTDGVLFVNEDASLMKTPDG